MKLTLAAAAVLAANFPVIATASPVDNYAAAPLVASRYAAAIAQLETQVARDRSDESALLNLALAYRKTGRSSEAAALYARVLNLDDVVLDTVGGEPMTSHRVARLALAQSVRIAAR